MPGARISVDLSDVSRKLGILLASLRTAILESIASRLELTTRQSFEDETSPEGVPWAPLSLRYALAKSRSRFRSQSILRRTGTLLRTIHSGVEGDTAFVSTAPLPHAAIHQYGGQAGRGHKATIPARPYLPEPETAERIAVETAEDEMKQLLKDAGLE